MRVAVIYASLCVALLALRAPPADAQAGRVSVRQSTVDKNAVDRPARIHVTWPDGGDDTLSVDLGVTVDAVKPNGPLASRWMIGPSVEYHRNTSTSKEQDLLAVGGTAIWIAGDPERTIHYTQSRLQYKRNRVKDTTSVLALVRYTPPPAVYGDGVGTWAEGIPGTVAAYGWRRVRVCLYRE